ncbi:MAG: peptide chain release factor N(5)-glutamine methyltransferase [Candidatus Acidiferrales bacterium]
MSSSTALPKLIRDAWREGMQRLEAAGVPSHALSTELLLMHVLQRDRAWLYAHAGDALDPAAAREYFLLLDSRAAGVPTQYLTGGQEFWGLGFEVTPAVLIPRPETEHVVEVALGRLGDRKNHPLRIADIGTGSGCIAVALAHELSHAEIFATDISPAALEVARRNATRHGVADRVHCTEGDLLQPVRSHLYPPQFLDMVVSNPPYIGREQQAQLAREVCEHEPHTALFAGPTGCELYGRLIEETEEVLGENGIIVLELGCNSLQHVQSIFSAGVTWSDVAVENDLAGLARVISAVRRGAC